MVLKALEIFKGHETPVVIAAAGVMILLQLVFGRLFDLVSDLIILYLLYAGWKRGEKNDVPKA